MFLFVFLMLAGTMALGFDPETGLSGAGLLKTVGFSAVLLALLCAGGWSTTICFDRESDNVVTVSRLFSVAVRQKNLAKITEVSRVVLQKVALLRAGPPGGRQGVFGGLFEPRSQLIRLFLETDDARIPLDEGSNADQLKQTGVFFADFLDTPFGEEELEP